VPAAHRSTQPNAWSRARRRRASAGRREDPVQLVKVELRAARTCQFNRRRQAVPFPAAPPRPLLEPQWQGRRTRARSAKWASSCRERSTDPRRTSTAVRRRDRERRALAPARQATGRERIETWRAWGARMTRMGSRAAADAGKRRGAVDGLASARARACCPGSYRPSHGTYDAHRRSVCNRSRRGLGARWLLSLERSRVS